MCLMSQDKISILTGIQDQLNTVDSEQELLSNDLDSALSLDRQNGTLTLKSSHPNHPDGRGM